MADDTETLEGPDLAVGVRIDRIADGGLLLGHVDAKPVVLVRQGEELFALGAVCTHQGGPLAEGLVVDGGVRALSVSMWTSMR